MSRSTFAILCALGLSLLWSPLFADEVHLVDGRKLVGTVTEDGDHYVVKMKIGKLRIAKGEVLKIVRTAAPAKGDPPKKDPGGGKDGPESAAGGDDADEAVRKRALGLIKLGERWVEVEAYKEAFRQAAKQYNRANGLVRSQDYAGAAKVYQGALEIFPDLLPAKSALAGVFLKLGRGPEALKYLKAVVDAAPGMASSRYKLGYGYEVTGKPRTAFKEYAKAYSLNPRMIKALEAQVRIARDLKMRAKTDLERQLARQAGVTLLSVFKPTLPDGYDIKLAARDRRIKIKKRVVQGGKVYMQTQSAPYTGLQIEKSTEYSYKVGQPEKLSTDDFIKKNSRLKKEDVYPVWLDDWRQAGWAFDFNGSSAPRMRLMKFTLKRSGAQVRKPVGTLEVTCFTYKDVKYLKGQISGARTVQNCVIWRDMREDDWPVDHILCLPFSKCGYVKVNFKLKDGPEIETAFVYDHERGITQHYSPAEWKKAAEQAPTAGGKDESGNKRLIELFKSLRTKMDAFAKSSADPRGREVSTFLTDWDRKIGALRQELMDANMVVVTDDLTLLRDQYVRELKGLSASQKLFFIEEIEKALGLR